MLDRNTHLEQFEWPVYSFRHAIRKETTMTTSVYPEIPEEHRLEFHRALLRIGPFIDYQFSGISPNQGPDFSTSPYVVRFVEAARVVQDHEGGTIQSDPQHQALRITELLAELKVVEQSTEGPLALFKSLREQGVTKVTLPNELRFATRVHSDATRKSSAGVSTYFGRHEIDMGELIEATRDAVDQREKATRTLATIRNASPPALGFGC